MRGSKGQKPHYLVQLITAEKGKPVSKIRLAGNWLVDFGFTRGAVAAVSAEFGVITFKLRGKGMENYPELVKHARKNKTQLAQARKSGYTHCMEVSGVLTEKAGFSPDDVFAAFCEQGVIHVKKLIIEETET